MISRKVQLLAERGETSRFISARIEEDGKLIMEAQDVGKAPREFFDDGDYEFWVTVPVEEKDAVLLALIEALYKGHFSAVDEFRALLVEKGIPHDFQVWT
jgi:hypothetical protein